MRPPTALLVLALAAGTSCAATPTPEPLGTTCPEGRVIVLIHGTGSTGEFDPDVGAIDPASPPAGLANAERNSEFDWLLGVPPPCPTVTFSYDNEYLALGGPSRPGVNAWNDPRSPWDRQPLEVKANLNELLGAILASDPDTTFTLVAYSAGGFVPSYWAATTDDLAASRVRSIVIMDGIVSGSGNWIFEWLCTIGPSGLRDHDIFGLGKLPCQFRRAGQWTTTVRNSLFWREGVTLATLRAEGDLVVVHSAAGIEPRDTAIDDPPIDARWWCTAQEWLGAGIGGFVGCTLRHGSVLKEEITRIRLHARLQ